MIAGSQGHRPFRPHESRLNECELQKPLFQHMQENMQSESLRKEEGDPKTESRQDSIRGEESEGQFI